MSIKLMTAAWSLDLGPSEKLVLLALADCSNDAGACWPSMATLSLKSGLTDRAIRAVVGRLVELGHLTRNERPGKGVLYTVHPGTTFPPEAASPRKETARTPERRSAKPSRTIKPQKATPSSVARATHLPADWLPEVVGPGTVAAEIVARWEPGRIERELSKFRDHWAAASGAKARKRDWQAAWRTWIGNADEFGNRGHRRGNGNGSDGGFGVTGRAAIAVFGHPDDDWPASPL